jgi:hypothetical protein
MVPLDEEGRVEDVVPLRYTEVIHRREAPARLDAVPFSSSPAASGK